MNLGWMPQSCSRYAQISSSRLPWKETSFPVSFFPGSFCTVLLHLYFLCSVFPNSAGSMEKDSSWVTLVTYLRPACLSSALTRMFLIRPFFTTSAPSHTTLWYLCILDMILSKTSDASTSVPTSTPSFLPYSPLFNSLSRFILPALPSTTRFSRLPYATRAARHSSREKSISLFRTHSSPKTGLRLLTARKHSWTSICLPEGVASAAAASPSPWAPASAAPASASASASSSRSKSLYTSWSLFTFTSLSSFLVCLHATRPLFSIFFISLDTFLYVDCLMSISVPLGRQGSMQPL
mmetsp:Transcript_2743/g.10140  ORF Transcript_2743/g.10140 Transcript_2743/m.10140 type:complete len:294 (-) Transcript_2743:898-1779(-)